MKTQSKVVAGLAVVIAISVAAPVIAQEKEGGEGKGRKGFGRHRLVGY